MPSTAKPAGRRPSRPARGRAALLAACLAVLALVVSACERPGSGAVTRSTEPAAAQTPELQLQADDRVDLALYFRSGNGEGAHLTRVVREVQVGDDLPRRAVEMLLDGPTAEDGEDLTAPLPTSTRLLGLEIRDGIATVDLSREVITDADEVGARPVNELLALAALADTLTEFPGIEAVELAIEGRRSGELDGVDVDAFWGGWGLPGRLVRDDAVVEPSSESLAVPDLDRFTREHQAIHGDDTDAVAIRSIRVRDRTTYIRLVVEVGDGSDPDATTTVPPAAASTSPDGIVVTLDNVAGYAADLAVGQTLEVGDPSFDAITVDRDPGSDRVSLTVLTEDAPEFWLHSRMSPTRVVLDIRK